MKRTNLTVKPLFCFALICFGKLMSCSTPQPGQPPPQTIYVRTFYQSSTGADLLDTNTPNAFKRSDLKVISKMIVNGVTKEIIYEDNGIDIYWDNEVRRNYFGITLPTNYGKTPIETYVRLSANIVDTVTYTFNSKDRLYIPDQVFYNKKLVWNIANAPTNGLWPPISIVK